MWFLFRARRRIVDSNVAAVAEVDPEGGTCLVEELPGRGMRYESSKWRKINSLKERFSVQALLRIIIKIPKQ